MMATISSDDQHSDSDPKSQSTGEVDGPGNRSTTTSTGGSRQWLQRGGHLFLYLTLQPWSVRLLSLSLLSHDYRTGWTPR